MVEAVRDASHAQKLAGDRSEMVDAQAGAVDDQIRGVVDKRDRRLVDGVLVKSNQISYISKDTRMTRNALILSGGRGLSKPGRRRHSTFAPFSDTCPRNQPALGQTYATVVFGEGRVSKQMLTVGRGLWTTVTNHWRSFPASGLTAVTYVSDNCLGTQHSAL